MKIGIVIPLWKRPEVTKFCFDGLLDMISKSKHDYSVTCVISEKYYEEVCDDYGFDWVFCENDPLGSKINTGIKKALEKDFDYLMMMNSDDIIDYRLIDDYYQPFFEVMQPFFGINRVTYVNFETKEAKDVVYSFSCLGIGKMIRRDIAEKGNLYSPERNRGLDDSMMDNLIHRFKVFPKLVQYKGQLAWDFKSEVNIWTWDKFKNKGKEVCYSRG